MEAGQTGFSTWISTGCGTEALGFEWLTYPTQTQLQILIYDNLILAKSGFAKMWDVVRDYCNSREFIDWTNVLYRWIVLRPGDWIAPIIAWIYSKIVWADQWAKVTFLIRVILVYKIHAYQLRIVGVLKRCSKECMPLLFTYSWAISQSGKIQNPDTRIMLLFTIGSVMKIFLNLHFSERFSLHIFTDSYRFSNFNIISKSVL